MNTIDCFYSRISKLSIILSCIFGFILSLALSAHAIISMKNPSDYIFSWIFFSFFISGTFVLGSMIEKYQCRICICSKWFEAYEEGSNKRVKVSWDAELNVSFNDVITDKFLSILIEKSEQKLKVKIPIKNSVKLLEKIEYYGGPDHSLLYAIKNSCT